MTSTINFQAENPDIKGHTSLKTYANELGAINKGESGATNKKA